MDLGSYVRRTNLYLNYLTTNQLKHYTELGYGLGQLMLMGEIGVFTSFENFKYKAVGVRINISLQTSTD